MDGNLLDPTVRSEQPPNSSNFSRLVTTAQESLLSSLRTGRPAPKQGRRRIMMRSISFLSDLDSLYESDTVTRYKLWSPKEMRSALPWCYNARTVVPVTERAQNLAQIEKLLSSHTLHGSESLCKLLRYLASHSMDHPGLSPKEDQIATEVLGRQQDFDPPVASMLPAQAARLPPNLPASF